MDLVNFIKRPNFYLVGIRFPKTVLLGSFLLTVIAFMGAQKLRIESDFTSFLPPDTESVQNLNRLKEYFDGSGFLIATVETEDPDLSASFADDFAQLIEQHPSILYVDHRRPIDFFKERLWLYPDLDDLHEIERRVDRNLEMQKKGVSPVFNDLMVFADKEDLPDLEFTDIREKYEKKYGGLTEETTSANDGKMIILSVKASGASQGIDASRLLMQDIHRIEQQLKQKDPYQSVTVAYTGSYQKLIEQTDQIYYEMMWVLVAVSFFLLLILYIYFKKISAALLIGVPLAAGVIWTGGLVYLILGHLNIITAFAAAILAGLGSDYGIYLLTRYYEERQDGCSFRKACHLTFSRTGLSTRASMITTCGAFSALLFSDFGLFVEFGVVGALGIFLSYLAIMLILPSLLALSVRHSYRLSDTKTQFAAGRWTAALASPRKALPVVIATVLVCGIASLSLPTETKVSYQDGLLEDKNLPSYQLSDRIGESLKIILNPTLLMVRGYNEEKRTVEALEALLEDDSSENPVFNKVFGLSSFVPSSQDEKKVVLARIHEKYGDLHVVNKNKKADLLKSLQDSVDAKIATREILPQEVKRIFESRNGKHIYAVHLQTAFSRSTSDKLREYHDGILSLQNKLGLNFMAVDGTFISDDTLKLIEREAPRGMLFILLFLFALLLTVIQPLRRAILIMAHLLGSLIILSGVLWLFQIRLNVLNIAMIPIILGTGIDSFVHLSKRLDEKHDLTETLRNKIPPIFVSNLTSIVGFGGLLLTSSAGLRSAGWVAVLGILIVTILCIFIFPRCLTLKWVGKGVRHTLPIVRVSS